MTLIETINRTRTLAGMKSLSEAQVSAINEGAEKVALTFKGKPPVGLGAYKTLFVASKDDGTFVVKGMKQDFEDFKKAFPKAKFEVA